LFSHRLLSVAQVRRAAHEVLREQALDVILEVADLDHAPQHPQEVVGRGNLVRFIF
jgi:hypothetical protein